MAFQILPAQITERLNTKRLNWRLHLDEINQPNEIGQLIVRDTDFVGRREEA